MDNQQPPKLNNENIPAKYFRCLACGCEVPEHFRHDNTKLDYCFYCKVPDQYELQEQDLKNIKRHGVSNN